MEKEKPKKVVVETYAEDMAKVIADDREGLVKKIIHGEEEHEKERLIPQSTKNKLFLLLGFFLLACGISLLVFFMAKHEAPTIPIEKQFTPIIFTDASASFEVAGFNKEKIVQVVRNTVSGTEVKEGGVEGIYLIHNKKNVGLREFVRLIKGNFVAGPSTLLINDNFLMGATNTRGKDFFILIKVRSLADVFPAMRSWEEKMFLDLSEFFAVSISSLTKYLLTAPFEDGIIQNQNARILYDEERNIVLMYVFADDESVIITNTEHSAEEVMERLAASRLKK